MSILNVFKLSYWFHQPFIARGATVWILVGVLFILILSGMVLKYLGQKKSIEKHMKRIINSFANLALAVGLLSLLWFFFRQEIVPFLAWRFWLLFLLVYAVYVCTKNIRFIVKRLPVIRAEHAAKAIKDKYLR